MISVGLIIVLFMQLVFSFFEQKEAEMRNKTNFYIEQGSAELMEWGSDDFEKAYNGGVVLEGDTISTKIASKGVMVLYNGTEIRFSENTEVTVDTLENHGDEDLIVLDVEKGEIWIDQVVSPKGTVNLFVNIDNVRVNSSTSVYSVLNRSDQAVRVIEGGVEVELMDREKGKDIVIDEFDLGVGQQIYMDSADVEELLSRRNMNFLQALSDEWKEGSFYAWNMGYQFELVDSEQLTVNSENEEVEEEEVVEDVEEEESTDEPVEEAVYDDPVLTLSSPVTNPYTLEGSEIYVTGTVDGYASKIVVTSYSPEGDATPYQLKKFVAGDTTWSYGAAIDYGNLFVGENQFLVVAYDSDGEEADSMVVVVEVVVEEEDSEQSTVDSGEESEDSEQSAEEVTPLACGAVTPVEVTTVAGEDYTGETVSVNELPARIFGAVECADSIYVNGYKLSLFESGSNEWFYTADESYGNISEGENVYEIYAVDVEGNRSESVYVTVEWVVTSD